MKLFKRRQNSSTTVNLPPEIQAYSQAEHRERMGIAWLVGIVSLLVTLIVLTGAFFGGRWLYRQITGNNKDTVATQTVKPEKPQPKKTTPKDTTDSSKSGQTGSTGATTTTPAQAPPAAPTTTQTSPSLVRTGPDVDL